MKPELHVSEEAEDELRTVYLWYESKRAQLGEEFLLCVEAVFETITRHPRRYRRIDDDLRIALPMDLNSRSSDGREMHP